MINPSSLHEKPNLRSSNDPLENVTQGKKMITLDKNLCTNIHCIIIYNNIWTYPAKRIVKLLYTYYNIIIEEFH